MLVPGQGQSASESESVKVRIYCYDVNLSDRRVFVRVNFGPTKSRYLVVLFVNPETFGVKPRFLLTFAEQFGSPAALLAVPRKRPIVYLAPFLLIFSNNKRSRPQIGSLFQRNRSFHPEQVALGNQIQSLE